MFRQPPVKLNFSFALTRQLVMPNPVCMQRDREKKISKLNWISNSNWNFTFSTNVSTSVFAWLKTLYLKVLKYHLKWIYPLLLFHYTKIKGYIDKRKITLKMLTFAFIGTSFCCSSPGLVVVHGETLLTVDPIGIVLTPTLFSPLKGWGGALTKVTLLGMAIALAPEW